MEMDVKVVELRKMNDDLEVSSLARWVLTSDGEVLIVETAPCTFEYAQELVENGIPSKDRFLFMEDGIGFLERLHQVFYGTYVFATEVFEMEESEALKTYKEKE
jgi:hypothetical protein